MMSRWCDQSIPDERHSAFSSGPLEVAVLFGTLVAETILASVHVRAHKQAGHMDASDLIKHCKTACKEGAVHIWKIRPARCAIVDRTATRRESLCPMIGKLALVPPRVFRTWSH